MAYVTAFSSVPQLVATVAAPVTDIATVTAVTRDLTVPGATPDMTFVINWPSLDAGLVLGGAWCAVAGTVKIRIYNVTNGTVTPAAATLHVLGL